MDQRAAADAAAYLIGVRIGVPSLGSIAVLAASLGRNVAPEMRQGGRILRISALLL